MSGIDKIIEQIEKNSASACDSVIAAAPSKADAVIAQATEQAQRITAEGRDKTAARVADIKKRGDSAAELEEKRVMLSAKQSIISKMLAEGLAAAKALPDNEYFELIEKMVSEYSQPEDGVILFGSKDISRLPEGFINRLNSVSKGGLTLSDEAADIDAGFILKYGGIEQNCSFDAVFAGESEYLSDRAGRLLF